MTPQDVAIAAGSGGGAFALVLSFAIPLAKQWAERRMRMSDRRSEVEIAGEEQEQRARIDLVKAQQRTVERVAEGQERLAAALEGFASHYGTIAQHSASVNDRLDRIEDALGIRRGSAVPVPPAPRTATGSSPAVRAEPPPRRQ